MIYVCELAKEKPLRAMSGHTECVNCLKWDPSRSHFLFACYFVTFLSCPFFSFSPSFPLDLSLLLVQMTKPQKFGLLIETNIYIPFKDMTMILTLSGLCGWVWFFFVHFFLMTKQK